MKRKFKLFATLASLCLSVALMAFGVYAATSSTYHVTSTVSFDAQVVGVWTGKVSGGASDEGGGATTPILDPGQNNSYQWAYDGSEAEANPVWEIGELKFGVASAAEKTLTYEFTFTNNSAGNANVKVLNTDSAFKIFNIRSASGQDSTQLVVTVKEAVAAAGSGTTAAVEAVAKAKGEQATDIKTGVASDSVAVSGQTVAPGQAYALVITVTLADFTRQVPNSINGLDIKLLATPSWNV